MLMTRQPSVRSRRMRLPVKKQAKLHEARVDEREHVKQATQDYCASTLSPLQDDVDGELFEIFKPAAHREPGWE